MPPSPDQSTSYLRDFIQDSVSDAQDRRGRRKTLFQPEGEEGSFEPSEVMTLFQTLLISTF